MPPARHFATDVAAWWPACRQKLVRPCWCTTAYPIPLAPRLAHTWRTTPAPDRPRTTPSGAPSAPPGHYALAGRAIREALSTPSNKLPPTSGACIPGSPHLLTDADRCSAASHRATSWPGRAPAPVVSSFAPPLDTNRPL